MTQEIIEESRGGSIYCTDHEGLTEDQKQELHQHWCENNDGVFAWDEENIEGKYWEKGEIAHKEKLTKNWGFQDINGDWYYWIKSQDEFVIYSDLINPAFDQGE